MMKLDPKSGLWLPDRPRLCSMFPAIHGVAGAAASGLANYFGSGADGDVTISSDTSLSATEDGNPVIKHYNSLTINASRSLTTNNRCKGLLVYVKGDCTINGTLKMDNRGASAAASADLDLSRSAPMALTDVVANATSSVSGSGTTRTVTLPTAGVADGMMMYICMSISSSADVGDVLTTPTNWTLVSTQTLDDTASTPQAYIYKRLIPGGGLGSSVGITSSASAISHVAVAFAVQNAAETINILGSWNTGAGTTVTCPAVTATKTGGLIIRFGVSDDDDQSSQPSMTSHSTINWAEVGTPGNGSSVYVYKALQPSTTVAASTFSITTEEHAGITFVIGAGNGVGGADDPLFPDESNQPTVDLSGGAHSKYLSAQAGASGSAAPALDTDGNDGSAGGTNQTGGGGSGGSLSSDPSSMGADGTAGTAFSGGSGGGGGGDITFDGTSATDASTNGGTGGAGGIAGDQADAGGGGGGAGNNGGAGGTGFGGGTAGSAGTNGTGGSLWLVVGGDLTIGASAIISADGGDGGDAGNASGVSNPGAGGGGSGGGRVVVLYKGTLSNSGTIRADGGAFGAKGTGGDGSGRDGGAGGAGTVTGPIQVV